MAEDARPLGRLSDGSVVESVYTIEDDSKHWYRLRGGPSSGRTFGSLRELAGYLTENALGFQPFPPEDIEPRGS